MLQIYSVKTQTCVYVCILKAKVIWVFDRNGKEIKGNMEGTAIRIHCVYVKLSNRKINR